MADKASKATQLLQRFKFFKPPWKVTGPASTAEYLPALSPSTEYRKNSPASQPFAASIPHADTNRVFNIAYYTRDTRRNEELVNKKKLVVYDYDPKAPDPALEALDLPPTPGKPFKWTKRKPLLDYDNAGYT